jgi:hypothetical protein
MALSPRRNPQSLAYKKGRHLPSFRRAAQFCGVTLITSLQFATTTSGLYFQRRTLSGHIDSENHDISYSSVFLLTSFLK